MRLILPVLSLGSLTGVALGLAIAGLSAPGSHVLAIAGFLFVATLAIVVTLILSE